MSRIRFPFRLLAARGTKSSRRRVVPRAFTMEALEERRLMAIDAFEPNDEDVAAYDLGQISQTTIQNLTIHHEGDYDFFVWTAPKNGELTARIEFQSSDGEIDFDLYDAETYEMGTYESDEGFAEMVQDVYQGRRYLVEIYSADGDLNSNYALLLRHVPGDVTPEPECPGDADYDGDVDVDDLNIVRNNFGDDEAFEGDADEDGEVGIADLNLVRNNFGADCRVYEVRFSDVWDDTVDVRWTDEFEDEQAYIVRWRRPGGDWQRADLSADVQKHRIAGLVPETAYELQIGARIDGEVEWLTEEPVPFVTGPSQPSDFTVVERHPDAVDLRWIAGERDPAHRADSFALSYRRNGGEYTKIIVPNSNPGGVINYRLSGLSPSSQYEFRLRARRSDDPTPDIYPAQTGVSRSGYVESDGATLVNAPSGVRFSDVWGDTVDVRWNDNSSHETAFVVAWRAVGVSQWNTASASANDTAYRITDLTSETEYEVMVGARGPDGAVSWSTYVESSRYVVTGPMRPSGFESPDQTHDAIQLRWIARFRDSRYAATEYVIHVRRVGGNEFTVRVPNSNPGGEISVPLTGLSPNATYEIQLRGVRADGSRSLMVPDSPLIATTRINPPTNVRFSDVWATETDVRWDDNSSHEQGFVIRWREPGGNWAAGEASANDTALRMKDLTSETYYDVQVGARGPDGRVSWSDAVEAPRFFVTAPMRPSNFEVVATERTSIRFSWTARYRVFEYQATHYVIQYRRAGSNDNWSTKAVDNTNPGGQLSTRIEGLQRNTSYEFQIRAIRNDDQPADLFIWQTGFSRGVWTPDNPRVVKTAT